MKNHATISKLLFLTCALSGFGVSQSSPPLGPTLVTVDKYDISSQEVSRIVQQTAKGIIDSTNQELKANNIDAQLSLLPTKYFDPLRLSTGFTNRPNDWYVKQSVIVGVQVHIPHWFDRQVYIPVDVNVSCDNWYTGAGTISATPVVQPASFEGGSWVEDAPGLFLIRDKINEEVRKNFEIPTLQPLEPGFRCDGLGTMPGVPDPTYAAILYAPPPPSSGVHHSPVTSVVQPPRVQVDLLRLKRLVAHSTSGAVLYKPTETVVVETYADYAHRLSSPLTMHENDVVDLHVPALAFDPTPYNLLVVIANINQQPTGNQQDSAFQAFPRSEDFSPGTHTVQISKTYVVPASGNSKPQFVTVPAYELTYSVSYTAPPTVLTEATR